MRKPETFVFTPPSQIESHIQWPKPSNLVKKIQEWDLLQNIASNVELSKHKVKSLKLLLHLPFFYFLDSLSILLIANLQCYFYSLFFILWVSFFFTASYSLHLLWLPPAPSSITYSKLEKSVISVSTPLCQIKSQNQRNKIHKN